MDTILLGLIFIVLSLLLIKVCRSTETYMHPPVGPHSHSKDLMPEQKPPHKPHY